MEQSESMTLTDFLPQRENWLLSEVARLEQELEQTRGALAEVQRLKSLIKVQEPIPETAQV